MPRPVSNSWVKRPFLLSLRSSGDYAGTSLRCGLGVFTMAFSQVPFQIPDMDYFGDSRWTECNAELLTKQKLALTVRCPGNYEECLMILVASRILPGEDYGHGCSAWS